LINLKNGPVERTGHLPPKKASETKDEAALLGGLWSATRVLLAHGKRCCDPDQDYANQFAYKYTHQKCHCEIKNGPLTWKGANDDLIAGILNRNGLVTGYGNRWTRERVTSLRSHHHIAVYKPADDGIEPWLNLSKAAQLLHVAPRTLRLAAEAGEIESIHPLPDGPWIFGRAVLSSSPARAITERARQNPKYPTGSHPDQQSLFSSIT